jgi:hypothetical protein
MFASVCLTHHATLMQLNRKKVLLPK